MRWIGIAALGLVLWTANALGWGNPGHATVCQIAYLNLTPAAKAEVDRLVPLGPLGAVGNQHMTHPYESFSRACTFPDNPHTRGDEHFVNYDRALRAVPPVGNPPRTAAQNCAPQPVCLFTAIEGDLATLRSTTASDAQRARALFYLGHWVGDIHQPLHVSYADDRGGNYLTTSGPCHSDHSHPSQNDVLHSAWDKCLVEYVFQHLPGGTSLPTTTAQNQWSNAALAGADLNSHIAAGKWAEWTASVPLDWAREGYVYTRTPGVGYCIRHNTQCWYSSTSRLYSGGAHGAMRNEPMNPAYLHTYGAVVAERLQQGGVRLAHMLNVALDPNCRSAAPSPRC